MSGRCVADDPPHPRSTARVDPTMKRLVKAVHGDADGSYLHLDEVQDIPHLK